jgi:hypothetical protein
MITVAPLAPAADPLATAIPLDIPALPTEPFGSLDLPQVDQPVTEWGIQQAHLRLLAHYQVPASAAERGPAQRPIGAQLDRALTIALDTTRWQLHNDHVEIVGSRGDHYRVTPAFCQGMAWSKQNGQRTTICKGSLRAAVGMCAHQLAVEYLRLAQLLEGPAQACVPTDDATLTLGEIAHAELPGSELFAILGRIRVKQRKIAEEDVELLLSMNDQLVSVNSGGPYGATSPATVERGALCTLEAAEFADLWSAISGDVAKDALSLTLAIQTDRSGIGLLAVTGPGLNVAVACTAMPC